MEKADIAVLGGGPAGIGAANHFRGLATIFEKRNYLGGLCSSFQIGGFRFDHAVHLSFTKDPVVLDYLNSVPYVSHQPIALNYSKKYWIKNPVQNNLFPLPTQEKRLILSGFMNRPSLLAPNNYQEWLVSSFGQYFAYHYSDLYTKKYWCYSAEQLSTSWCGKRIYLPSIKEVEYGASHESTPNVYYAKEMRYPQKGGYQHFFNRVNESTRICLGYEIRKIDPFSKTIFFTNGSSFSYKHLLWSLPLNRVSEYFLYVPKAVADASKKLVSTSMANVSIGFSKKVKIPSLWFYIYDEDVPCARAYSPSWKSGDNAPFGKSSLQFEYYFVGERCPLTSEKLIAEAEKFLVKTGIAKKHDIEIEDVSFCPYANVVFLLGMEENRQIVLDYLLSIGVTPIGRFGQWDYLWSDQSYLSGFNVKI